MCGSDIADIAGALDHRWRLGALPMPDRLRSTDKSAGEERLREPIALVAVPLVRTTARLTPVRDAWRADPDRPRQLVFRLQDLLAQIAWQIRCSSRKRSTAIRDSALVCPSRKDVSHAPRKKDPAIRLDPAEGVERGMR
jgi:hypothetical protein